MAQPIDQYLFDKVKGLLLGLCLGDALGVPYEFRGHNLTYSGDLSTAHLYKKDRFGHIINLDPGQLSDDSEMTLTIANYLSTHLKYTDQIVLDYLAWANHPTTWALGRNTRDLFKGVTTIRGYKSRFQKKFETIDQTIAENQQSNGHLMRSALLALCKDTNVWQTDCKLTNPSKVSMEANLIYLSMIRTILDSHNKLNKHDIIQIATNLATQPVLICAINDAKDIKLFRDVTKNKGWTVHALYCAIYSLLHFDTYTSAINWVISLKGDTDTNAAISGALNGIYYGYKELEILEQNNLDLMVNCTTTQIGNKQRPDIYRLCSWNNVDKLVTNLVTFYKS